MIEPCRRGSMRRTAAWQPTKAPVRLTRWVSSQVARGAFQERHDKRNAGVVDPDGDGAQPRLDLVGRRFDADAIGDVEAVGGRAAPRRLDVRGDLACGIQVQVSDGDRGPFVGKGGAHGGADAAATPGDDGDFPGQSHVAPSSSVHTQAAVDSDDLACDVTTSADARNAARPATSVGTPSRSSGMFCRRRSRLSGVLVRSWMGV